MKDVVLEKVRRALRGRPAIDHPGPMPDDAGARAGKGTDSPTEALADLVEAFRLRFQANGGEVVRVGVSEVPAWLEGFSCAFASCAVGRLVPPRLTPPIPEAEPEVAHLGVSLARCAVAGSGTVILDARDGRRAQLLPRTHLVWVRATEVVGTLGEGLHRLRGGAPSALGLHSGPSKSADIGQVLVTGVHGPGRVLVAIVDDESDPSP